ncbi:hypothetical protein R1flu_027972 [Riccia fluitans]|uniref:Uncharacterized protein n=1 Tax=Riccia fluitans TaxID=41844 RepID=A0ABD1XKB6_9MARC
MGDTWQKNGNPQTQMMCSQQEKLRGWNQQACKCLRRLLDAPKPMSSQRDESGKASLPPFLFGPDPFLPPSFRPLLDKKEKRSIDDESCLLAPQAHSSNKREEFLFQAAGGRRSHSAPYLWL